MTKELIPSSTGGWLAMIALIWALLGLTFGFGDNTTWRDVIMTALGSHAIRRGLEGFKCKDGQT